eukprot:5451352-Prymnesium_polylepis.1
MFEWNTRGTGRARGCPQPHTGRRLWGGGSPALATATLQYAERSSSGSTGQGHHPARHSCGPPAVGPMAARAKQRLRTRLEQGARAAAAAQSACLGARDREQKDGGGGAEGAHRAEEAA